MKGGSGLSGSGLPAMIQRPPQMKAATMGLRPSAQWADATPEAPEMSCQEDWLLTWDLLLGLVPLYDAKPLPNSKLLWLRPRVLLEYMSLGRPQALLGKRKPLPRDLGQS